MQKKNADNKPVTVAKAALIFGSGTLTSRILGLIRDALVLSIMPLEMKDAWIVAFRVPNFFRRILGEGGLSVSFIPILVASQKLGDREKTQALMNGVFTLLMSLVSLICLVTIIFMDDLIPFWLNGKAFTDVPGKIEMTVVMARIMMGFLFFVTLFAYFMALLNSAKKFALSGFAPVGLNVAIILGLYFFRESSSLVEASAYAVLFGGALQALILFPQIFINKLLPKISFQSINHPLVKRVLSRFVPTFFGVGVLQILTLINTSFASQLEQGAVTYIFNADRMLELPLSLIAVSIGTTLLPTLSEYWAKTDMVLFKRCIEQHFKLFYFLAIPASFGLWFIGGDIIQVLFARGHFSVAEAGIVGDILQVYSLTLICAGSLKIFNQSFYASQDTLTPALIAISGIVVHIFMAPYWMDYMGIQGLVLSTALATLFNLLTSIFILSKRVGSFDWKRILPHGLKCFVAASAMGGYLYSLQFFQWKQGRFILDFPILLVLIAVGAVIYFAFSLLFKVDEVSQILRKLKARV